MTNEEISKYARPPEKPYSSSTPEWLNRLAHSSLMLLLCSAVVLTIKYWNTDKPVADMFAGSATGAVIFYAIGLLVYGFQKLTRRYRREIQNEDKDTDL